MYNGCSEYRRYYNVSVLFTFVLNNFNKLTVNYLKTTNDVTIKSCEQELITKECIAMHTN